MYMAQRREQCAKKKEKKKTLLAGCSIVPCVHERKGRGVIKKRETTPPCGLPVRGGPLYLERGERGQQEWGKKEKMHMRCRWEAEVGGL